MDTLDHLRGVEMGEESTRYWSLLDGRYLATYAAERRRAPPRPRASSTCAAVWKGRRIAATDLLLSTYGLVAGRRIVGDAELNPPSEPEYVL